MVYIYWRLLYLNSTDSQFDAFDSKFDAFDSKFDAFDSKFDSKFDAFDSKFDSNEIFSTFTFVRFSAAAFDFITCMSDNPNHNYH